MIVAALFSRHHRIEVFSVKVAEIDRVPGFLQSRQRLRADCCMEAFGKGMAVDVVDTHGQLFTGTYVRILPGLSSPYGSASAFMPSWSAPVDL